MTKMWSKTDIKRCFFARRAKKGLGQSPPQELEEGPRSGPYLLVALNTNTNHPSLRWGTLEVICLIYSCRTSTGERAVTKRVNTSQINPLHSTAKRGQLSRSLPGLASPRQGCKAAAVLPRQMERKTHANQNIEANKRSEISNIYRYYQTIYCRVVLS